MKRLMLVLLLATPAFGAETYSIAANDENQALVEAERVARNRAACLNLGLSASCTQAQADAVRAGVTIYPATTAGRQALVRVLIQEHVVSALARNRKARGGSGWCSWFSAASQAEKDAECAKAGESAGCDLCP